MTVNESMSRQRKGICLSDRHEFLSVSVVGIERNALLVRGGLER